MIDDRVIEAQLSQTLVETNFSGLGALYRGKVRDVYRTDDRLVIVTSDRVSAFDHVLGTIPFKGEILNRIAVEAFAETQDVLPNHLISAPDPQVMVTKVIEPHPIEFVVRGYITGSLWRDYVAGKAGAYGVPLRSGLRKDQRLEQPIITPATKAAIGEHDEPISAAEIVSRGLMTAAAWEEASAAALKLFTRGSEVAARRGLILVDTKYEMGLDAAARLTVIDEIHTPDCSRYWIAEGSDERFVRGEPQRMLDKENLREWLIKERGFDGHGVPPALDDGIRVGLAKFYVELYERRMGRTFEASVGAVLPRITANLARAGLL